MKIKLTEDNVQEVTEKLNELVKHGGKKTVDWLKFCHFPEQRLDELKFENFPVNKFTVGSYFSIEDTYKGKCLVLKTEDEKKLDFIIFLGSEILFDNNEFFVFVYTSDLGIIVNKYSFR